jgi:hypothetical protein
MVNDEFESKGDGEVNPVVVPEKVSDCVSVYAFEKVHQDPEVDADSAGNVIVFDGPVVNRKMVPPRLEEAVKSTVVPATFEVT